MGPGSIPGRGNKIPQAMSCGQKKKKSENDISSEDLGVVIAQGGTKIFVFYFLQKFKAVAPCRHKLKVCM